MNWEIDILGETFEQATIPLANDYGGAVKATLVRKKGMPLANNAILYIHGFNDYFFQEEMADKIEGAGANFYALDLRRYGRSFMPHQNFNDIRDLKSYYEEIKLALKIIQEEGNKNIILMGHSTGGLIVTLFSKDNTEKGLFDGIILNSPFFEFNMSSWIQRQAMPYGAFWGRYFPNISITGALSEEYGASLHKDYKGEWDYDLQLKPNTPPPITLGWLRAIRVGHKELKQDFKIVEPVLVMHSAETITNKFDLKQMQNMDGVLNVKDIQKIASNIKGNVSFASIENGMHDLILSKKEVREKVYLEMNAWIEQL